MFSVDYSISGNGIWITSEFICYPSITKLKEETYEVLTKLLTNSEATDGEYFIQATISENGEYYDNDEWSVNFKNGKVSFNSEG